MIRARGLALLLTASTASASRCQGSSLPGGRNVHPIDVAEPVFVKSVKNGKLYSVGQGDDKKDLLHLWGTPCALASAWNVAKFPIQPRLLAVHSSWPLLV